MERSADLEAAEEIKDLFIRNGRAGFGEQFDLVYPQARDEGGASWLARDEQGRMVGHIAIFPRQLRSGGRECRAVVFADMMFDEEHRNFFAPAQLARAATSHLRKSKEADFAYAWAIDLAAGVLRAGGLKIEAQLQRYVRPLNPLYNGFVRLRTRSRRFTVETIGPDWEGRVAEVLAVMQPDSYLRGPRTVESYATRVGRESMQDWLWFILRPRGGSADPVALILGSRVPDTSVMTLRDVLWDDRRASGVAILNATAGAARRAGYSKLAIHALTPSRFATELRRAGFFERQDTLPFLTMSFREGGLPDLNDFLPTFMDGTAW